VERNNILERAPFAAINFSGVPRHLVVHAIAHPTIHHAVVSDQLSRRVAEVVNPRDAIGANAFEPDVLDAAGVGVLVHITAAVELVDGAKDRGIDLDAVALDRDDLAFPVEVRLATGPTDRILDRGVDHLAPKGGAGPEDDNVIADGPVGSRIDLEPVGAQRHVLAGDVMAGVGDFTAADAAGISDEPDRVPGELMQQRAVRRTTGAAHNDPARRHAQAVADSINTRVQVDDTAETVGAERLRGERIDRSLDLRLVVTGDG